jgi:hypothetical protein
MIEDRLEQVNKRLRSKYTYREATCDHDRYQLKWKVNMLHELTSLHKYVCQVNPLSLYDY